MTPATADDLRRRVLVRFGGESAFTRAHLDLRSRAMPLAAVLAEVPGKGTIVELGCGHGLVSLALAEAAPARSVTGLDIDPARIASARCAAEHDPPLANAAFEAVTPGYEVTGPLDAFVVVDALYLLPRERQRTTLAAAAAALRPGGLVVVKELDDRPRVKAAFARMQEVVATRVLTPSAYGTIDPPPAALLDRWLRDAGLEVASRRLDRRRPWPHHLTVGRRPTAGS